MLPGLLLVPVQSAERVTQYRFDPSGNMSDAVAVAGESASITASPQNQLVARDGDVYLTFQASGPGPLSYQWLSNAVAIASATGDVFALPDLVVPRNAISNGGFEFPIIGGSYLGFSTGQTFNGWTVE